MEKQGLHLGAAFFGLHLEARRLHLGAAFWITSQGKEITSQGREITSRGKDYILGQGLDIGAQQQLF